MLVQEGSLLWQFLSPSMRVLVGDGEFLIEDSKKHIDQEPTDYSYLVFPFAKLYEGFLKQLFLETQIMSTEDYKSDHFRIGKTLSPTMASRLGKHSAYAQISRRFGEPLAAHLWHMWKEGRNLVFHYFPHNYRALTRDQAVDLSRHIVETMEEAVRDMRVRPS